MADRVLDVLSSKEGNYILPFFWQHGEPPEVLSHYMDVIKSMGISAVCVESRPHPDFAGPGWWHDMDLILQKAKRLDMKVWILDDSAFPTGYANGSVKQAGSALRRWTLYYKYVDVPGPCSGKRIPVEKLLKRHAPDYKLLGVTVWRRTDEESSKLTGPSMDLTDSLCNGQVYLNLPAGNYRIFVLYLAMNEAIEHTDYINFLEKDSVKLLLDAVYEPHYEHYREYFGNTLAGFFSDEPGFYNAMHNTFDFDCIIGKKDMPLPSSLSLLFQLEERYGKPVLSDLVGLWYDTGENCYPLRYHYMDLITRLYETNFSLQLGDWCHSHGVSYIGHVLEDNNSHSRLGPGVGHYFRAMTGQDMSGIDVVHRQVEPGRTYTHANIATRELDGEFFHYGIAKLGSSSAHLDKRKQGRAMCELFGAFGWSEGLQEMKWITDHMLVRGINVFVPHAFSPKEFPDWDSPPHFYAHGHNLQHLHMNKLFHYMNRAAHILNGGVSRACVGILYPAEAEWSAETMLFQKPARKLMEHQIDYELIPCDLLTSGKLSTEQSLIWEIGNCRLKALIIPYAQRLPHAALEALTQKALAGFPLYFLQSLPEGSSENTDVSHLLGKLHETAHVLSLEELPDFLSAFRCAVIRCESFHNDLRAFQYGQPDQEIVMLFQESIWEEINEEISFCGMIPAYEYDPMENKLYQLPNSTGRLSLHLLPGQARFYLSNAPVAQNLLSSVRNLQKNYEIAGPFEVSIAKEDIYPSFNDMFEIEQLIDLSHYDWAKDFHGAIHYATTFEFHGTREAELVFTGASQSLQVWINGHDVGCLISPDYRFDISAYVKEGQNSLAFETITTVFPMICDDFSLTAAINPMGIIGNIVLYQ